jgi:hypothetical protein
MSAFAYIRDLNPQIDDIGKILGIIQQHEGDNGSIALEIKKLFDADGKRRNYTLHSIKANTMSSLRTANLGVMNTGGFLTPFGKTLLKRSGARLKAEIARHLILNKGGLAFCRALKVMPGSNRTDIASFLAEKYRVDFWRDLNNISTMHGFLEWAGICANYRLNDGAFAKIVGIAATTAKAAEELSPEANALLQALARSNGAAAPGELRSQAELISGRRINPHNMPAYGKELEKRGLIELPGHRGSKTRPWKLKDRAQAGIIAEIAASVSEARPLPDETFRHSFAELLKGTNSPNVDQKGRALEYLAARICWKLGLRNIEVRKLSDYEIDVRAEALKPVFQKWVMQCKATRAPLGPAAVLREYGIAKLENIPVIVFFTTSSISDRARAISDDIMRQSNKIVLILDREQLERIAADENAIYDILEQQSEYARSTKLPQKQEEVIASLIGQPEETSHESGITRRGRRPLRRHHGPHKHA